MAKVRDPNQMHFDWAGQSPLAHPTPAPEGPVGRGTPPPPPVSEEPRITSPTSASPAVSVPSALPPGGTDVSAPVQSLPWDFVTTFPMPTDQAIETGILGPEDCDIETLHALHNDFAAQCLGTLCDTQIIMDARRRGIDPRNGKPPKDEAAKQTLAGFYQTELQRLESHFGALMGAYEDAFGDEAADAFEKMLRARIAGVPVFSMAAPSIVPANATGPQTPQPPPALPVPPVPEPPREPSPQPKRLSTRLPVPRPLASAVAAGHFGVEEDGTPVRPTPDEVRAIAQDQAEKLVDLLGETGTPNEAFHDVLKAYAQDFGEKAAQQLGAHAQKEFRPRHEVR